MNEKQRKAAQNIRHAANDMLGGLENAKFDYDTDDAEYIEAEAMLKDHDALVKQLYTMATTAVYRPGLCSFNKAAEAYIKDIRFCGKEWLMAACDKVITEEGY